MTMELSMSCEKAFDTQTGVVTLHVFRTAVSVLNQATGSREEHVPNKVIDITNRCDEINRSVNSDSGRKILVMYFKDVQPRVVQVRTDFVGGSFPTTVDFNFDRGKIFPHFSLIARAEQFGIPADELLAIIEAHAPW